MKWWKLWLKFLRKEDKVIQYENWPLFFPLLMNSSVKATCFSWAVSTYVYIVQAPWIYFDTSPLQRIISWTWSPQSSSITEQIRACQISLTFFFFKWQKNPMWTGSDKWKKFISLKRSCSRTSFRLGYNQDSDDIIIIKLLLHGVVWVLVSAVSYSVLLLLR